MGWRPFLAAGSATVAAAAIGGAGTDVTSPWYRKLDLPRWQPPGQVIGVVWTVLYATIAGATGLAADRAGQRNRRRLAALLGINLGLNAAWPWVFFRARRPGLGVAVIGGLEASTVVLTREVARTNRAAALALVPYLGWNLFALTLNAVIAARNHGRAR